MRTYAWGSLVPKAGLVLSSWARSSLLVYGLPYLSPPSSDTIRGVTGPGVCGRTTMGPAEGAQRGERASSPRPRLHSTLPRV